MFQISAVNTALLVIDVQKNLIKAMDQNIYNFKLSNMIKIAKTFKLLNLPYLITQQYTKGLGDTVDELTEILGKDYLEKITFSCCKNPDFFEHFDIDLPNILVMGMETHVCVLQTVLDLLNNEFNVFVAADAVISRTKENWKFGLSYMSDAGAIITTTEAAIFMLLERADTDDFKEALKFLK